MLEHGFVTHRMLADGNLVVAECPGRNRNFKVMCEHQQSYFVKQIRNWDHQSAATIRREATCYQLAETDPDFHALRILIPRYYHFDPARNLLVVELLPNSVSLTALYHRQNSFPPSLADRLGTALGSYHEGTRALSAAAASDHSIFPRETPWILSLHHHAATIQAAQAGGFRVLEIVQEFPEFQERFSEMQQAWQRDCLIHGDMKWENCIGYRNTTDATNATGDDWDIKIVDWELSDIGDPCWDIGAIFQSFLTFWIMSMEFEPQAPATHHVETARYPLEAMQPAINAFWNAYAATRGLPATPEDNVLVRSTGYCAARMIQTAYEYAYYSSHVPPQIIALLQVSMNILKEPATAIQHLFGIERTN